MRPHYFRTIDVDGVVLIFRLFLWYLLGNLPGPPGENPKVEGAPTMETDGMWPNRFDELMRRAEQALRGGGKLPMELLDEATDVQALRVASRARDFTLPLFREVLLLEGGRDNGSYHTIFEDLVSTTSEDISCLMERGFFARTSVLYVPPGERGGPIQDDAVSTDATMGSIGIVGCVSDKGWMLYRVSFVHRTPHYEEALRITLVGTYRTVTELRTREPRLVHEVLLRMLSDGLRAAEDRHLQSARKVRNLFSEFDVQYATLRRLRQLEETRGSVPVDGAGQGGK